MELHAVDRQLGVAEVPSSPGVSLVPLTSSTSGMSSTISEW
jgi:hypothetical protein